MSGNRSRVPSPSASPDSGNGHDSRHAHIAAIIGSVVGGIVGLLLFAGGILWFVYCRKTRKPASLLDMTGTRTEPTPFAAQQETTVLPPFLQSLASYIPEKQRRKMEQEGSPLLYSTAPHTALSSGATSAPPGPSTTGSTSHQSRQDELVGLRTDIEDLRRIVLNAHIERPEGSEAPPEYS